MTIKAVAIKKITVGFVVQEYNPETGRWTGQEFVVGDQVDWEDEYGNPVDPPGNAPPAPPLDMVQPSPVYSVYSVWDEEDVMVVEEENGWEFTPEQRREILDLFKSREDASVGLNWGKLYSVCVEVLNKNATST